MEEQTNQQFNQPEKSNEPVQPLSDDAKENKVLAIIAYLGILCLIPLLLKKDSPFAQFHGKQGLVLLLAWIVASVVMIVPILGWLVGAVAHLACLVLMIVGIVHAVKGEAIELPWIGKYVKSLNL